MECQVPYPSDPPRVRAIRLGAGGRETDARDVQIFPDDTVNTALVKIAAAFGRADAKGPAPYVWKAKRPVALTVTATAWRPGYHINPFKVAADAASAETAALAPTVKYHLSELVQARIGDADGAVVYVAFPEDVPPALRANQHYFSIAQSALRRPREVARETEALLELWQQPTDQHPETVCHFNHVAYDAPIPAGAPDAFSLYERLHARAADFALIQWVADPTRVLYKLAGDHAIPKELLETWTAADRLPTAGTMIQMYSLVASRAETAIYARIVLTPTVARIVYHIDPREKIGADAILPHFNGIRRRLEDVYGAPLRFTETEISARTDIALPGLTVRRFAAVASKLRALFQIIQLARDNTLDMLAVRTQNYAAVDVSEYVASKLRLGVPPDVIFNELRDYGETDTAIQDALDRARDIVRALPAVLPAAEIQRRVQTGLHIYISFAGFGLRVQLNGAANRSDLTRTLHWIRCCCLQAAATAPPTVPSPAAAAPPAAPAPIPAPAPVPEITPATPPSPVSTIPSEDLAFLEGGANAARGGAVGKEDARYFLNQLQAADPKLFSDAKGYATKCGATAFRQPVVVSRAEKAKMDAEGFAQSYDSAIEYGSDAATQNVYMCPRIWCQVSRRPLTPEQARTTGCPLGEKPKLLYTDRYWDFNENKQHHIGFHKDRTETGLCMPCCGAKPVKAAKLAECSVPPTTPSVRPRTPSAATAAPTPTPTTPGLTPGVSQTTGARRKEEKNLLQQRTQLPEGRYGTVPKPIHDVLLPDTPYQLCTTTLVREECAVRRGVMPAAAPGEDTFMPALLYVLNFATLADLIKALRRRLDPLRFMALENGRVLAAFAPTDPMFPEDLSAAERRALDAWYREHKAYRRLFGLPETYAAAASASPYVASRELAVFHAYEAFFKHLAASEEPKNPYMFYDIARLFDVSLILWERTSSQMAQIRCPFFQTTEELLYHTETASRVAMILQDAKQRETDVYYEPIELKKVSGTGEYQLTQARVGPAFLTQIATGCSADRPPATVAAAANERALGILRALAQWVETIPYDAERFRLRTLVLGPDLAVTRVVTAAGIHILLPPPLRLSPRALPAALTYLTSIRRVAHHDDLTGTTSSIECLTADLALFRAKLRELGLGDEIGRAPAGPSAAAGVTKAILTVPPPDPNDGFPVLLAAARRDADLATAAREDQTSRDLLRMEQRVGQTLLFYYDTLVAPLLARPRRDRVAVLANTFPDVPAADREKLQQVLASLPVDSPETLAAHLRHISAASHHRLPFHTADLRRVRTRKGTAAGEWQFSQAAVEMGLPDDVLRPVARGSARPRPDVLPQPKDERVRAAAVPPSPRTVAARAAAVAPLPALMTRVAEKPFPIKWTDVKSYSWNQFKILHRAEPTERDLAEFFEWLAGDLQIPFVWSDVQYATFQAISRALLDAPATESISDDPAFRAAWLRYHGRAATTGRTQFNNLMKRTTAAERQTIWAAIGPAAVAGWPSDTTLMMAARLLDVNVLVLLERSKSTTAAAAARRGSLEDLVASSLFFTPADTMTEVLKRPLVVFFKELGDEHVTYSLVQTPEQSPYYRLTVQVGPDIKRIIESHLNTQKE